MAFLTSSKPLIVLPAAGRSSRMRGADKLLEPVEGTPLLKRQAQSALATGCPVTVTVPNSEHPRATALLGLNVQTVPVPDRDEGMSASLRRASRLCEPDQPLMILLPDVPGIGEAELRAVLEAFRSVDQARVVQAQGPAGQPGTPVIFPSRLLAQFETLTGDDGAKSIITAEKLHALRFADDRATRDLDTPEEWSAWRSETGKRD